ncbi:MAG: VCBS repeat-containing protein [Kofleriaceae bacterium]|nr:VCBS repeat-containing protein [Kofleriaceae bacterium]
MGIMVVVVPAIASAQRFADATDRCFATTAERTNRVELADIDGDGTLDVLFANGGDLDTAGDAEPVRAWRNLGSWSTAGARCTEVTGDVGLTTRSRVVRAVDIDRDGDQDLIAGGAFQSQLRLLVRGAGGWTDGTPRLPQQLTSVGDLEAGDVDGDGDLDLVLAEWGAELPTPGGAGGRTRLYLNNGTGTFTEATATRMPDVLVKWARDIELVDIDRDWDLDIIVACSYCISSFVFTNDGQGTFTNADGALPSLVTEEIEPLDLDGDGDLDLVALDADVDLREHFYLNNGGVFNAAALLPSAHNPANVDDTSVTGFDVDADGRIDLMIGGASDRLLVQQTNGTFVAEDLGTDATPNTLALAAADLDGDDRIDVVNGQGGGTSTDTLALGGNTVSPDSRTARVVAQAYTAALQAERIHAHVLDARAPVRASDFTRVWVEHNGYVRTAFESPPQFFEIDMVWAGGTLWSSPELEAVTNYRVCATDRAQNTGCSDWIYVYNVPSEFPSIHDGAITTGDAGTLVPGDPNAGGCCDAGASSSSSMLLALAGLALTRRRLR